VSEFVQSSWDSLPNRYYGLVRPKTYQTFPSISAREVRVVRVPQVDKVLREPVLAELAQTMRRELIAELVREEIEAIRREAAIGCDENSKNVSAAKAAEEISAQELAPV